MTVEDVCYIVTEQRRRRSAFLHGNLGFNVDMHPAPGFASLSRGDLRLLLNQPGAGGAGRSMDDGRQPAPGGWNRIQLEVEDIEATVSKLKAVGAGSATTYHRQRRQAGPGRRPSGNAIELFQPSRAPAAAEKSNASPPNIASEPALAPALAVWWLPA
jgi:hypothetical protein